MGVYEGAPYITREAKNWVTPYKEKWREYLQYFSRMRFYFEEVVQIFELNRVESASKDYPTPLRFVQTSPRFWSWTFLWDSDRSKLGLLSVKIIIQLMIHPRVFSLFSKSSYKKHYLYNEKLLQRIQLFKEDDTSLQSH